MAVTNPAMFSSIKSTFGGSSNFKDYYRGGPYVLSTASTTISTTASGLKMSQFNGVSAPDSVSVAPATNTTSASGNSQLKTITSGTFTATPDGGNGTYSYSWTVTSYTGCYSAPTINSPTAKSTTVTATISCTANAYGDASTTGTINLKCTVTSNGATASDTAIAYLVNYNTAVSCVTIDSILADGKRAGDLQVGDFTRITHPYIETSNSCEGKVLSSETYLAECVRIELASGAWLECSTSAPIPTRDNEFVIANEIMGEYVASAAKSALEADPSQIEFEWDEVVNVVPIGDKLVQRIYVADRCFWASGDGNRFLLHHNAKPIAPP